MTNDLTEGNTMTRHRAGADERGGEIAVQTTARGYDVLRNPALNKGAAFSSAERLDLDLIGLLPPGAPRACRCRSSGRMPTTLRTQRISPSTFTCGVCTT